MKEPKFLDGSWVCESEKRRVFAWLPVWIDSEQRYAWLRFVWRHERQKIENGWHVGYKDFYYSL